MANQRPPNRIFIYDDSVSLKDKSYCRKCIQRLGGTSNFSYTYVSEATHIVTRNSQLDLISPKVLGCLASGKHVVTIKYLEESHHRGYFIDESIHTDERIRKIHSSVKKYGKSFRNLTCLVYIKNETKKTEFQRILRDGGASVPNWSIRDLSCKPTAEITNVNKIFTDHEICELPDFKTFVANRDRAQWRVQILHYFYLFKFILTEPSSPERRKIEGYFDIKNEVIMHDLKMRLQRQRNIIPSHPNRVVISNQFKNIQYTVPRPTNQRKRGNESIIDLEKENKRPCLNSVRTECKKEEFVVHVKQEHFGNEIRILKLKQLRIDNCFKIKRENIENQPRVEPEIITLDDDEEEIQIVGVVEKKPMLIRRNKKHFKQENVKPYIDSISLPNNPTVSEVKRNIALEDDVIKKILPQLQRQNNSIKDTLANPVATPSYQEVKPPILPPGISWFSKHQDLHGGRYEVEHEVVLLDESDEDMPVEDAKCDPYACSNSRIPQKKDEVIDLISDDEEEVISKTKQIEPMLISNDKNCDSRALSGIKDASKSSPSHQDSQIGSIKIRSLKYLTGESPPKPTTSNSHCISVSLASADKSILSRDEKFHTGDTKYEKRDVGIKHNKIDIEPSKRQNSCDTNTTKDSLSKEVARSSTSSGKTWGLSEQKWGTWESDEEDDQVDAIDTVPDNDDDEPKSMIGTTIDCSPEGSMSQENSEAKDDENVFQDDEEALPSQAIDASVETASRNSIDSDAETVISEHENNTTSDNIALTTDCIKAVEAERQHPDNPQDNTSLDNGATDPAPVKSTSSELETHVVFDLKNLKQDTKKYIKALINRQKITNECIDIADNHLRTPKFDSKNESGLPDCALDERRRPNCEPFSSYATTQLFDTTFNVTEEIGPAELLDTIEAISSATCSKLFPRYIIYISDKIALSHVVISCHLQLIIAFIFSGKRRIIRF